MIYLLFKITIIAFIFIQMGEPGMIFSFYQKAIDKFPQWLYKPFGGCLYCFTGQVCFWGYLIKYHFDFNLDYNLLDHLFFTMAGIFLSSIYDKIWNYEQ